MTFTLLRFMFKWMVSKMGFQLKIIDYFLLNHWMEKNHFKFLLLYWKIRALFTIIIGSAKNAQTTVSAWTSLFHSIPSPEQSEQQFHAGSFNSKQSSRSCKCRYLIWVTFKSKCKKLDKPSIVQFCIKTCRANPASEKTNSNVFFSRVHHRIPQDSPHTSPCAQFHVDLFWKIKRSSCVRS